jgi:hypothetical protein
MSFAPNQEPPEAPNQGLPPVLPPDLLKLPNFEDVFDDPFGIQEALSPDESHFRTDVLNTALMVEKLKSTEIVQGLVDGWNKFPLEKQIEMVQIVLGSPSATEDVPIRYPIGLPKLAEKAIFASFLYHGIVQFNLDQASEEQNAKAIEFAREQKGDEAYEPSETEMKFYLNEVLIKDVLTDLHAQRRGMARTMLRVAGWADVRIEIADELVKVGEKHVDYATGVIDEVRFIQTSPEEKYQQTHEKVASTPNWFPYVDAEHALDSVARFKEVLPEVFPPEDKPGTI